MFWSLTSRPNDNGILLNGKLNARLLNTSPPLFLVQVSPELLHKLHDLTQLKHLCSINSEHILQYK